MVGEEGTVFDLFISSSLTDPVDDLELLVESDRGSVDDEFTGGNFSLSTSHFLADSNESIAI